MMMKILLIVVIPVGPPPFSIEMKVSACFNIDHVLGLPFYLLVSNFTWCVTLVGLICTQFLLFIPRLGPLTR